MDDILTRFWQEIMERPSGPLALRFYLQPLMATIFAVKDGLRDAREGNPAYFWAVLTDRAHRRYLLQNGWKSTGKIFFLALILDLVYQVIVLGGLRPVEGLVVAIVLALVPYLILRGPVSRIARLLRRGSASSSITSGPLPKRGS